MTLLSFVPKCNFGFTEIGHEHYTSRKAGIRKEIPEQNSAPLIGLMSLQWARSTTGTRRFVSVRNKTFFVERKELMMKLFTVLLVTLCAFSIAASAGTYVGPVYPAPGGNSYSSSGDPITAGGLIGSYGNFNPAAYNQLWWTVINVANPYDSSYNPGGAGNMAFFSYTAGVAEWNSTQNLTFYDPLLQQYISFPTRFLVENVTGGATYNPIPFTPAWLVSGNYSVQEYYQGFNGSSWVALGDLYNSYHHNCGGGCLQTSEDGGFYYSVPEVGDVSTLLGFGIVNLAAVLGIRRRVT